MNWHMRSDVVLRGTNILKIYTAIEAMAKVLDWTTKR